MSDVVLICATLDEGKLYSDFETVSVRQIRALDGRRISAAFATRRAMDQPGYANVLIVVKRSIAKTVGELWTEVVEPEDLAPGIERVA